MKIVKSGVRSSPPEPDFDNVGPYATSVMYEHTETGLAQARLHTHKTGSIEVPISGGKFSIECDNGVWLVPMNTAAWVPPGMQHRVKTVPGSRSISMHLAPEVSALMPATPVRFVINPMTREMFLHFTAVYGTSDKGVPAWRLASMIVEQLKAAPQLPDGVGPLSTHPTVRILFQLLSEAENRSLTNAELAEKTGTSLRTLTRIVQSETGMTIGHWRLQITMMYALQALNSGSSVEATASDAGYNTVTSFIKAFERIFHMTPGSYRRSLRQV